MFNFFQKGSLKNKNYLKKDDFLFCLRSYDFGFSKEVISLMKAEIENVTSAEGFIHYEQFANLWKTSNSEKTNFGSLSNELYEMIKKTILATDDDDITKDYLTSQDLLVVFTKLNLADQLGTTIEKQKEAVKDLISSIDIDNDNKFSRKDFEMLVNEYLQHNEQGYI